MPRQKTDMFNLTTGYYVYKPGIEGIEYEPLEGLNTTYKFHIQSWENPFQEEIIYHELSGINLKFSPKI